MDIDTWLTLQNFFEHFLLGLFGFFFLLIVWRVLMSNRVVIRFLRWLRGYRRPVFFRVVEQRLPTDGKAH